MGERNTKKNTICANINPNLHKIFFTYTHTYAYIVKTDNFTIIICK